MEEYDIVRVVRLDDPERHFSGSAGVMRPPQIGDIATIVNVNERGKNYCLEFVASSGLTIWLADFTRDELEIASVMSYRMEKIAFDLKRTAVDAEAQFGRLSGTQLNWKPDAKSWSIAQCFDHLIKTHSLYFPELERLASDDAKPSFWEKASPLSGFFGRFLIKSLDPKNPKKMKTTAKASPSASDIGADIIGRFRRHQDQMGDHLRRLPDELDPAGTIITSPLMGFVTYSLADTLTFVPMHCERHCGQARRVMESAGFPQR